MCFAISYLVWISRHLSFGIIMDDKKWLSFCLRRSIFDFEAIKKLLACPKLSFWYVLVICLNTNNVMFCLLLLLYWLFHCIILFSIFSHDSLHGVAGVYVTRIFVEELGAKESSLLNCTPKVFFIFEMIVLVLIDKLDWTSIQTRFFILLSYINRKISEVGILIPTWPTPRS